MIFKGAREIYPTWKIKKHSSSLESPKLHELMNTDGTCILKNDEPFCFMKLHTTKNVDLIKKHIKHVISHFEYLVLKPGIFSPVFYTIFMSSLLYINFFIRFFHIKSVILSYSLLVCHFFH